MTVEFAFRIETTAIEEWFRQPPELISAMASKPTLGVTRAFVLQWTKFSQLFPRWVGAIMSKCPEFEVIAYEVENLMSEVVRDPAADGNHYELLIRLGESVGLNALEIESFPATVQASELFEWLWERVRGGDWLEGFTAVNGLEVLGDRDLPERYGVSNGTGLSPEPYARELGLSEESLEFFEVSDAADAGHGRGAVEIIAKHTPEAREDEVLKVFSQSIWMLRKMMESTWELAERIDLASSHGGIFQ